MATRDDRLVVFRVRPEPGVTEVDVRGEMTHWSRSASMTPAGDGWFEARARVAPGVYEYKFRASDDDWFLDPANPRTRSADGVRNNVLVVGGTEEPVLHAPARPYVFAEDDGRTCVRAALRKGAGDRLELLWDEGAGFGRSPMRRVGEEREHLLFEAHLPGAGRTVEYLFALENGTTVGAEGGASQAFRVAIDEVRPSAPQWWRDAVVYTVFVDRFRAGGRGGAWADSTRYDNRFIAGGDLAGVVEALPYLQQLGVSVLHLTPIVAAPSPHRYDCVAPRRVADELGGEDALAALLAEAHARELRVLLDVTLTHVHRDFFAFRDVTSRGRDSAYWDWFDVYRHPFSEGERPGYRHYQRGVWWQPLLRTDNPEVQEYLLGTFRRFAALGVDGFRLDAAADVPLDLVREIRRAVRAINGDAAVFGEIIPAHIQRWTADGVDAATDFATQQAMYDWLLRAEITAAEFGAAAARRRFSRGGPAWTAIGFAGTHDQARIATLAGDARAARLALLMVITRAPVPLLYYGDEVGLRADEPSRAFEDSWPDRQCMPWDDAHWDAATLALCRDAIRLRNEYRALRRGDEELLDTGCDDVVAYRRTSGDEVIDVLLHRGDAPVTVRLDGAVDSPVLLSTGDVAAGEGDAVVLGPRSGVVLLRSSAAPEAFDVELLSHNRALAAMAHAEGAVETPALPAILYVTVTEACNLRCAHCITNAPALTAARRARTLRPWVLDALAEPFAAADYVAFTHGGESMTAPIFPEVLRAIQRARAGRPGRCDVHLVTNGTLLDGDATRRLIDGGVTSLMVSLDGATARTNDAIRLGGRFDRVYANLAEAIRVRRRTGADLRVGISTVVGRTNLRELPDLARLAAAVGVDWLKLEETCPVNGFSRADVLDPRAPELADAVAAVREILTPARVVLVDHLDPPRACRCDAPDDADVIAFRDADDYANRVELHPCRAAWEQACIDPDGTVHAVDYAHPPLGNLLDAPLFTLWNSAAATRLRSNAPDRFERGRRS